jgi:hypothetical protein
MGMKRCPECEGVGEMEYESGLTARFKMMWVVLKAIGNYARTAMAQVKLRRTKNDRGSNKHGVLREAFRRIR